MSPALAQIAPRFVRRTTLNENESRVNFKQIDNDVIQALTSAEAREVTPLMPTIYLTLLSAPQGCWERAGVLRFVGEDRDEGRLTAWEQMRGITGVANSTLSKALDWMSKTGVIGYDARANGVGIRVFINRAASSIRYGGKGSQVIQSIEKSLGASQNLGQGRGKGIDSPAKKNLSLAPTPTRNAPTPIDGARFKEHGIERDLENYIPRAYARIEKTPVENISGVSLLKSLESSTGERGAENEQSEDCGLSTAIKAPVISQNHQTVEFLKTRKFCEDDPTLLMALSKRIVSELRPEILTAVKRETEDAKEWLLKYGLPKATRVAQRETFDILRSQGALTTKRQMKSSVGVGRYENSTEKGREGNREIERITQFLAETSDAVRRAATHTRLDGKRELQCVFQSVAGELESLQTRLHLGEDCEVDDAEARLTALESRLKSAIWEATEESELEGILKSARDELKEYAGRMEANVLDEAIRNRAWSCLRERYEIPRISLFYA